MDWYIQLIASIPAELHKPLHVIGFMLLYVISYTLLSRFKLRIILSLLLCLIIAITDESIRGFDIEDVVLDMASAVVMAWLLGAARIAK